MSFIFEPNSFFHCQMDFDYIFKNRKEYKDFDDLLESNKYLKKEELYYFAVAPDDKTVGYNILLSKYKEPFEYKIGQRSKVVNYQVLGTYSMDGALNLPAAKDTNREELGWTVTNPNVYMMFSKMHIELYEECGSVYKYNVKDKAKHILWSKIKDKYEQYYD